MRTKLFKKIFVTVAIIAFLTPSLSLAAANEFQYNDLRDDANLVAYYKFEADGTDELGAYSLSAVGSPAFSAAKFNNGLDLGTSNSSKAEDSTSAPTNGGSFSVGGWFKVNTEPTNDGNAYALVRGGQAAAGIDMALFYYQASSVYKIDLMRNRNGIATDIVTYSLPGALGTTDYNHIMGTYNNSTGEAIIYLNGANVASGTISTSNGNAMTAYWGIGYNKSNAGLRQWASTIQDDWVVFNDVLTPSEVDNIANGTSTPAAPSAGCTRKLKGTGISRC